jgi:site-specific DNA-adenine methylase
MFSYMGSKWRLAKRYGAPLTNVVVEPFAGAACYALYHNVPKAILFDLNPHIAGIWDYLIKTKESEILKLPLDFENVDELKICPEAKWLIGFWITKGNVHPNKSRSAWARKYRNSGDCKVWGEAARLRISKQVNNIRDWEIRCEDYRKSPNIRADWFIDPPYEVAGKHYTYSEIDYDDLAKFCLSRKGPVTVCENRGAEWLPFTKFVSARAMTGKNGARVSHEVVFQTGR